MINDITNDTTLDIATKGRCFIDFLDSKKAIDPIFMDLRDVNSYLSYFIITTGNSQIHCKTLAKEFEKFMLSLNLKTKGKANFNSDWIILDFGDLIAHFFTDNTRYYYQLEKLWADANIIKIENTGDNYERF